MVILAMPFFIGMIGQTRYILMKCLSLTYYQSQQLQEINRNSPRPPIAPYRHVTPLDRQTYYQHHRQARETAHAKNGERIFCLSLPSMGAKVVFHKFMKNLNIGLSKIRHS